MKRPNPVTCSRLIVGGMASSWRCTRTSTRAGPGCARALRDHRPDLIRRFGPQAEETGGLGHLGEIGVVQVGREVEEASRLHLQLDEGERVVREHDDLDGQVELPEREEIAHAASPARRLPTSRRPDGPDG